MGLWNRTDAPIQPNCTLDTSYRFTYYQVSYSVIFVLGLASNALAFRRLWLSPRALTSTTVYMTNLAVADLFFVVSLPLRIYYYHYKATHSSSSSSSSSSEVDSAPDWYPGGIFCQLTFTLKYISLYGGIFFLVCIGVDRYFAVVHPLAQQLRRVGTARLISVGIWCLVLALSLALPLLRSAAAQHHQPCLLDPSSRQNRAFILAALVLVQAAFQMPALLLLFSYCSVLRVLRRQPRRRSRKTSRRGHHHAGTRQHHNRHRHTLTVIYWVLGVFLLCFTPYHLNLLGYTLTHMGLLQSCLLAKATKALHPVVLSLASANCCFNPLIYYVSSGLAHRDTASSGGSASL
ncbi:lysophosphatidic acid receptor 6-like [Clupea harengus]|uniref:Lysophosphatidic acid receptor 6-like n=1 Tax=Clupea harengus TaxID=7950 RepID=A0A6P8FPE6_CLUHA|nr:lysophosphatidic acid receptor 6-like [Clupea harengus]